MALNSIGGKLRIHIRMNGLKALQRKSPKLFKDAMKKGAIQFLNWANNGSAKEPRKPPIRWGVLRGSSSAFVGNDLVTVFDIVVSGTGDKPTPLKTYSAADTVITWIWNTAYATKLHETKWNPGPFSRQDGDTGNKWVERHLRKDKEDLIAFIAKEFKKKAGT